MLFTGRGKFGVDVEAVMSNLIPLLRHDVISSLLSLCLPIKSENSTRPSSSSSNTLPIFTSSSFALFSAGFSCFISAPLVCAEAPAVAATSILSQLPKIPVKAASFSLYVSLFTSLCISFFSLVSVSVSSSLFILHVSVFASPSFVISLSSFVSIFVSLLSAAPRFLIS